MRRLFAKVASPVFSTSSVMPFYQHEAKSPLILDERAERKSVGASGLLAPFSFFIGNCRPGGSVFSYKAPIDGAKIYHPTFSVHSVSGDVFLNVIVPGMQIDPIKFESDSVSFEETFELPPLTPLEISVSGEGEIVGLWITFYAGL